MPPGSTLDRKTPTPRKFDKLTWPIEVDVILRDRLKQEVLKLDVPPLVNLDLIAVEVVNRHVPSCDQKKTVKEVGNRYQNLERTVLDESRHLACVMAAAACSLNTRERRGSDQSLDQYDDKFVVFDADGILASGDTRDEAVAKALSEAGVCEADLYVDYWGAVESLHIEI